MTRMVLVISLLCATGAAADVIQQDGTGCGQPNSNDISCRYYIPPFFWPATQRNAGPSFSGSGFQQDTSVFTPDPGFALLDSNGAADVTEQPLVGGGDRRQAFDLVYDLTAGGTTYRIDQPVEFAFSTRSGEFSRRTHNLDLLSSDPPSLVVYPKFDPPWVRELPEPGMWSELLSISICGAMMAGLATLGDRRMLP